MTATQYIIRELEGLISKFPQIRVRYEYDRMAEVHLVEVIPNDVYRLDDKYIEWEDQVTDMFTDLFPNQNICFISDDSLISIRNAEYISEGLTFAPLSTNNRLVLVVMPSKITMVQTSISKFNSGDSITLIDKSEEYLPYMIPATSNYRLAA